MAKIQSLPKSIFQNVELLIGLDTAPQLTWPLTSPKHEKQQHTGLNIKFITQETLFIFN